ncbi:MAG: arginine--tRNA ligase [Lachnospiraceae bacterium]|nr:arginine--tRNA ligase [Lachnospiraceae bacterium]MBR5667134.1 arginine--tRNA ligase [Lachnospiraceae bacterium]
MEKIISAITEKVTAAFQAAGYEERFGAVKVSDRPDLCQYQCNGAMSAAKQYHKAPILIANEIVKVLAEDPLFSQAEAVAPGFINLSVGPEFLADYVRQMQKEPKFGLQPAKKPQTVVVDYGGANVAKPLHVGHMRPAVIGEAVKRILRYAGHTAIGDAHLGDWGTPIGLIITELKVRQPDLVYFDPDYTGEYPKEAPFSVAELEEIYPYASKWSKEHDDYREESRKAILELQQGRRGYMALWEHIMRVSMEDLRKNYDNLGTVFDVWGKESDAQKYIPDMIKDMKDNGYAHLSEGALVVDVKEETDTKEMPPCMILKSDGATLYNTTDLATIVERMTLYNPDRIVYIVDKRQSLYFEQIFRCAKKTGIVKPETDLVHIGFGTMTGKDGKPFKTRDGGVMRLSMLIDLIVDEVRTKMADREMPEEERDKIAKQIGLAALKYGDLSNQSTKDYIFDIERFTSFEGNTGPYILYTMVRIKSILAKIADTPVRERAAKREYGAEESALLLTIARFSDNVEKAVTELAPMRICQYIYELADCFNGFYHANKIVTEPDEAKKAEWISLLKTTLGILNDCIDMLGFEAPDKM